MERRRDGGSKISPVDKFYFRTFQCIDRKKVSIPDICKHWRYLSQQFEEFIKNMVFNPIFSKIAVFQALYVTIFII
jgi:hypothetical protein